MSCHFIAVSIILNILKTVLPYATHPQEVGSHSLPVFSPYSLLGCFSPSWKMCCLQFPPERSYTYSLILLLIGLWSAWPEDSTYSVWFPSHLSAHLQCLMQPLLTLLLLGAAESHLAQLLACCCWAEGPSQYFKEVQKLAVCPICLMSIQYEELIFLVKS